MALPILANVRFDDAGADPAPVASRRWDYAELAAPERTAEGFLRGQGNITRSGVFRYARPDGSIVREYRPPEEVFHPDSLRSFSLIPLTLGHPPDNLTPATVRDYQVGSVGHPERVGNFARADILITDAAAIAAAEAGQNKLSCGYTTDVIPQSGIVRDEATGIEEPFDVVQTRIRGNHLAQVHNPRAGEGAHMRVDSADGIADSLNPQSPRASVKPRVEPPSPARERNDDDKERTMALKKIKIGGQEFELEESAAAAITAQQGRLDTLEAQSATVAELQTRLTAQQGTIDVLQSERQARADEAAKASAKQKRADEVKSSMKLYATAIPILEKKLDELLEMDPAAIMRACVEKECPTLKLDGKDAAYIEGAFNTLASSRTDSAAEILRLVDGAGDAATREREDGEDPRKAYREARSRAVTNLTDAWKKPTAGAAKN